MAVNWMYVRMLDARGMLRPGLRILDIGSSNLYSAPADGVREFLAKYNPAFPDAARLAERLAEGSYVDPVTGARNGAFVGELFEAAGMEYLSFDIAKGYKTEVLDFNQQSLPDRHRGAWDLILNFGTTEHVLHQYNSFKIIHEAARVGGTMWHQLPSLGFVDHCYFTYKPRFFFELAGYNEYELVDFWYGAGGQSRLMDVVKDYASYFPVLGRYADDPGSSPQPVENLVLTNVCANALYRKVKDRPFMGTIERSTSVGEVPDDVMAAYHGPAGSPAGPGLVARLAKSLRRRLRPIRPLLKAVRPAPR
ncbi:hypothetical protein J0H58_17945 [bacterium]|nr:hypothetical protein [bacterium]